MNIKHILLLIIITTCSTQCAEEITPYAYTNFEELKHSSYVIPPSARFTVNRSESNAPDIIYYLSKPKADSYPITIFCGGSTNRESLVSIIHMHRYFLKELLELNSAVITVELWGIDGSTINADECMHHYTRSQRLKDHQAVIEHIQKNPPQGWDGRFIFLGVSEGGPLVIKLTEIYSDKTIATINWSGAGDWSWKEELWAFICALPPSDSYTLPTHAQYNATMQETLKNPSPDQEFLGMTYKYHADALLYPAYEYEKITTPFLVVSGAQDSIIGSSDDFVKKAQAVAGSKVAYLRVKDMNHYVRRRPDVIQQSFAWLEDQIRAKESK